MPAVIFGRDIPSFFCDGREEMQYPDIEPAVFLSRPNRFLANIRIGGQEELCHVKNTGRCRELLIPGTRIYVQRHADPERKTKFSLITVEKGKRLVNLDSQLPNRAAEEWLEGRQLYPDLIRIHRERKYGQSRMDFYLETQGPPVYLEVKGVTLEENGTAAFPDAPTQRGVRHLQELCQAVRQGYRGCVLFVIQMEGVDRFTPNWRTHPAFGEALLEAERTGVRIVAVDCRVTPDSVTIRQEVPVDLGDPD